MRYHYSVDKTKVQVFGTLYFSSSPIYERGTLFKIGNVGMVVIQQRYDPITKHTWWSEIDSWLSNELYLHPKFEEFFKNTAGQEKEGMYPTVTIRQIMWALRMKPLKRESWETYFDRRLI